MGTTLVLVRRYRAWFQVFGGNRPDFGLTVLVRTKPNSGVVIKLPTGFGHEIGTSFCNNANVVVDRDEFAGFEH
jgi:hypothetical protein